jgi:two-component sensor histidine kinase
LNAADELLVKGDFEKLMLTYLNIADTYKELRRSNEALDYHKKAVALGRAMGQTPNLNYLGNAYRAVGEIDTAIMVHEEFLTKAVGKRNKLDLMWTRFLLGQDYFQAGKMDESLKYYYSGLQITRAMDNKLDVVINLLRIADVHLAKLELIEAKQRCEESIAIAKKIKVRPRLKDGYAKLAKIEALLNNHSRAYYYMEKCKMLSDSLTAGEADLQFAKMQAQFDLDKKILDIERLRKEKELNGATIKNRDQLIVGFVIGMILLMLLALSAYLRYRQKNKANKILQEQKQQIETLLSEIHHRVKNNLQVISSLLSIQSDQLKNKNAKMAVLEGQSRVQAMGLIHENIYQTENFAFIDMKEYVTKLTTNLLQSFGFSRETVTVEIKSENISVDVDTAIPLGLIINELFTNSLKHAFKGTDTPYILISMVVSNNHLLLELKDNGVGYLISSEQNSFGLKLVKELTHQLGGTIDFESQGGFKVSLRITKFKLAA